MSIQARGFQKRAELSQFTSALWFVLLIVNLALASKRYFHAVITKAFRKIDVKWSNGDGKRRRYRREDIAKEDESEFEQQPMCNQSWILDQLSGYAKLEACLAMGHGEAVRSVELSGYCYPPYHMMTDEEQRQGVCVAPYFQSLKRLTRLCEFKFAMTWDQFDARFLELLNPECMTSLDVPVRLSSDVVALAEALGKFSKMKTLKLRHVPAYATFSAGFSALGSAIKGVARTLRHLTIELTSRNRPSTWDVDDFVLVESALESFRLFFPASRRPRHEAHLPSLATFNLETLRLKNFVSVSKDSFAKGGLFEPSCLRSLELPRCTVEPGFWDAMSRNTNSLVSIGDVDYNVLDEEMAEFLAGCHSLKALSLSRPRPVVEIIANVEGWLITSPLPRSQQPKLSHEGLIRFIDIALERPVSLTSLRLPWPLEDLSTHERIWMIDHLHLIFKVDFEPKENF